jgi:hypothetical protein
VLEQQREVRPKEIPGRFWLDALFEEVDNVLLHAFREPIHLAVLDVELDLLEKDAKDFWCKVGFELFGKRFVLGQVFVELRRRAVAREKAA